MMTTRGLRYIKCHCDMPKPTAYFNISQSVFILELVANFKHVLFQSVPTSASLDLVIMWTGLNHELFKLFSDGSPNHSVRSPIMPLVSMDRLPARPPARPTDCYVSGIQHTTPTPASEPGTAHSCRMWYLAIGRSVRRTWSSQLLPQPLPTVLIVFGDGVVERAAILPIRSCGRLTAWR